MPSLPRIKRTRPRSPVGDVVARPEPRIAELQAGGFTWIHLDSPTADEANMLAERFGWHPLDIEDVLSKRQRPKIDEYADDGYLFAVLHFPVYDKAIQRLNAGELDFFLGPDYLVTLPAVELLPVTRLFRRCEDFEERAEDVVRDISNVKQEIISYRKIIKPERSTLRLLERRVERFLPEELELYFDDIVDSAERIWDLLDNYKEVVDGLEDTNDPFISLRQNDFPRILTVFSVVLLPLTLITGVFGMNVHFPGEGTHTAFWVIVGIMVATIVGLVSFFRYKRWL